MTASQEDATGRSTSPSASFYDVSDDEEGEYNTIAQSRSGRGVKLLFSKSKVYVHPTPSSKDNIAGFVALIQQKPVRHSSSASADQEGSSNAKKAAASSYLLAWVPERSLAQDDLGSYVKVDMSDNESPPKQTYLVPPLPTTLSSDDSAIGTYAFALPLSNIYSLLIRPPSLGWWYGSVVVNPRSGSSLPALFFHDAECESTILQKKRRARDSFDPFGEDGLFWGGDEVLRWLKRYIKVERSAADPSIYLIDPTEEDRIGFGPFKPSPTSPKSKDKPKDSAQKRPEATRQSQDMSAAMDPFTKALKETRWKILEQLSKVTTFTRRTAQDIADNPKLPPQVRRLLHNPEVQTLQDEFDSARLYLARWAMGIAEQSERERNQRLWTGNDVLEMEDSTVGEFEILDMATSRMSLSGNKKLQPMTLSEWDSFFDQSGKLQVTVDEVKERIFHGGLDPDDGVRKEAWLFLLGVHDWDSTAAQRASHINAKRDEYIRLKGAWWERMVEGNATAEEEEWWREQKSRIEKDVHRTDRHIPLFAGEDIPHPDPSSPFHNPDGPGTNVHLEQLKDMLLTYLEYDHTPTPTHPNPSNPHPHSLGYVQGMSDLLAPLYAVTQDDALAFWAFTTFMRRMERNFVHSQSGMRAQLALVDALVRLLDPPLYAHLRGADSTNFFFFFRMLLVWYKREFDWSSILRLWEALWTDYRSSQFHVFIALAILERHRGVIIEHLRGFDEVLKYINELSGTIDVQTTLVAADALFDRFEKVVAKIDRKDHFPAPSTAAITSPPTTKSQPQSQAQAQKQPPRQKTKSPVRRPTSTSSTSPPPNAKTQANQPSSPAAATETSEANAAAARAQLITPELRALLSRKIITLETMGDVGASVGLGAAAGIGGGGSEGAGGTARSANDAGTGTGTGKVEGKGKGKGVSETPK